MVNFGEFLQAEVERPEAKHTRVFFVDYHALKVRLYEIDEGGAASFEVSLGVQLTSRERAAQEARVDAVRRGVRCVFLIPFPYLAATAGTLHSPEVAQLRSDYRVP